MPADRITELDWWESHTLPRADLTVTATPSQHFSGRRPKDRNATLWSSLVIRSRRHSVFFSGDTGLTDEYATIREHFGPFSLAMHAWDDPPETLLALGPKQGVQLDMPRLGEPVEPDHADRVTPWWRAADAPLSGKLPVEPPAMTLPRTIPWPLD